MQEKNFEEQKHQESEAWDNTIPNVNICESGKSYQITVPVSTFNKDDIRIDLVDNKLVIESKNRFDTSSQNESSNKILFREFEIPADADQSKIKAQMQNGILSVCITKRKEL